LSIKSLKGFDGVDGASDAGGGTDKLNSPLLGYLVRIWVEIHKTSKGALLRLILAIKIFILLRLKEFFETDIAKGWC